MRYGGTALPGLPGDGRHTPVGCRQATAGGSILERIGAEAITRTGRHLAARFSSRPATTWNLESCRRHQGERPVSGAPRHTDARFWDVPFWDVPMTRAFILFSVLIPISFG